MSTPSLTSRARLGRHDFLRFDDHRARRLHADCGTLWVTLDGELQDIEIDAGHSRDFDGRAALTVGDLLAEEHVLEQRGGGVDRGHDVDGAHGRV